MSYSTAKDLATYIASLGYGTEGTDIFINIAPDPPDNVIEINDSGGIGPLHSMGSASDKPDLEITGIQVKVRNNSSQTGFANIFGIYKDIDGYNGTINTTEYLLIEASQTPFLLYKDENNRWVYACNFLCKRRTP